MTAYQITILLEADRELTPAEQASLLHLVGQEVAEPRIHLRDEDGNVGDLVYAEWQPLDVTVDMHPARGNIDPAV